MARIARSSSAAPAARRGDRIYILGHYDVETVTPHLALVRIHE